MENARELACWECLALDVEELCLLASQLHALLDRFQAWKVEYMPDDTSLPDRPDLS